MFVLRATAKLRQRIGPSVPYDGEDSTTLLGDWYATMLPWRPQVALLVNERTLLPALMPLAPAATMPTRVTDQVGEVLAAHGVPDYVIRAEIDQMSECRSRRRPRSIVGAMNEFAFLADTWRDAARPNLLELAVRLAATPYSPRTRFPTRASAVPRRPAAVGSWSVVRSAGTRTSWRSR